MPNYRVRFKIVKQPLGSNLGLLNPRLKLTQEEESYEERNWPATDDNDIRQFAHHYAEYLRSEKNSDSCEVDAIWDGGRKLQL